REAEEVEDWFRERDRHQAAEQAAERQRTEAIHAEQRRREWLHVWTQYALDSLPSDMPREAELDVHAAVQEALGGSQPNRAEALTLRLLNAAVTKALRPWHRREEMQRAIDAAMNRLPGAVRYRPEWGALKQRAWDAAANAVARLREEAGYAEMEAAASNAVQ